MKLIVGLGNIGGSYNKTYHNIGFMVVDRLAKKLNCKFDLDKCKSMIAQTEFDDEKIIIAKPKTFMNNSGVAVVELCKKFRVKNKDVLIVFDDFDLPLGKVRFREFGSAGTHNGMRSVIEKTQTEEIPRVRVGIGKDESMLLVDYVTSKIEPHKMEILDKAFDEVVDLIVARIQKQTE